MSSVEYLILWSDILFQSIELILIIIMSVHENIKKIRHYKQIPQKEISALTGIPQGTLSKIEGGADFSWSKLVKISEALGVKIEDIIGFNGKMIFNQIGDKTKGMVINQSSANEKQYHDIIKLLKDENSFLRKALQKALGKKH
jgi:transcriptional regulator with XRE-family HTH domain